MNYKNYIFRSQIIWKLWVYTEPIRRLVKLLYKINYIAVIRYKIGYPEIRRCIECGKYYKYNGRYIVCSHKCGINFTDRGILHQSYELYYGKPDPYRNEIKNNNQK